MSNEKIIRAGQTWQHKTKNYNVKVTYINKSKQLVVEDCETRQKDGFSQECFLDNFTECT